MRLIELFEAKPAKKTVKSPAPRNFVAKNSSNAGRAGAHDPKKYNRKEKHKSADFDE